jgi:putative tricarboxylic transport membrane protein
MLRSDRYVGVSLLFLSAYVCYEGLRLKLGTVHNPGAGFVPFWIGGLLGCMALILILRASFGKGRDREGHKTSLSIGLVVLSLFGFNLILESLGFILCTFLFIIFLLKIVERKSWLFSLGMACPTAVVTYFIFEVLLEAQLPRGIFSF